MMMMQVMIAPTMPKATMSYVLLGFMACVYAFGTFQICAQSERLLFPFFGLLHVMRTHLLGVRYIAFNACCVNLHIALVGS